MIKSHLLRSAVAVSMVATFALAGSAMAADPTDDLTVSGQSDPTLELSLTDLSAAFGTTLTPDGISVTDVDILDGVVEDVDLVAAAGACYVWAPSADEVSVSSNVEYNIGVDSSIDNPNLFLHNQDAGVPTGYADCATGAAVVDGTGEDPMANIEADDVATAAQGYNFWVALVVEWTDAPDSASLGAAVLTFTAENSL